MFVEFYYVLRNTKIPVSITEFLSLMDAISKNLILNSTQFYYIARSLLVKDEKYYDLFDETFMYYFRGADIPLAIKDDIFKWLEKPKSSFFDNLQLTPEERELLEKYDWEELKKQFEARIQEQLEEHNGGNYWIGTRGKSPFGWGGKHPAGIRVGGWGGMKSAIKIAQKRHFRDYRSDRILDTRQIQVALRKLRKLSKIGAPDELNLDKTIDETCRQGGEIEFIWEKRKKNNLKLLLLMDVGGSMDPFTYMVEQLFSAANKSNHFKKFKHFYFHNCIYNNLYESAELWHDKKIPLGEIFQKFDKDYRVVLVGDAAMAPYELMMKYGAIDYYQQNETAGIEWLHRFKKHFSHSVWLNPEVPGPWISESRKIISKIFPMFQLSLDGLEEAISKLIR
ncbi:VWA domain-containing protein [Candidatus Lokiarchaeum ossiferum]|uniref:VWA domain-containing protein n=1 Tax=Candidatus Lokiarchaeum ossiferum TaxID=2951803 RepID=UPI00352E1787